MGEYNFSYFFEKIIYFLSPHPAFGHLPPEWEGFLSSAIKIVPYKDFCVSPGRQRANIVG